MRALRANDDGDTSRFRNPSVRLYKVFSSRALDFETNAFERRVLGGLFGVSSLLYAAGVSLYACVFGSFVCGARRSNWLAPQTVANQPAPRSATSNNNTGRLAEKSLQQTYLICGA